MLGRLLPGAEHLQNPHPLVVHFPIAFLYGAALLYFLAWITRRESIAWVAFWFLFLGLISAAVAIATGWWSAGGVMLDPSVKQNVLQPHMRLMIATGVTAGLLTVWAAVQRPMPITARYVFLIGLLLMIALMTKGADYGGMMVYDYNGGGGACQQPIAYTPNGAPVR